MKTNNRTWILAIAACAALAVLTGCPTGDGGGSGGVPPPVDTDTSPVQTLAAGDVVIEITKTNTQPRAGIAAKTGNYYWVYQADELIDQGTVRVSGNAITFNSNSGGSSFKLTLTPGNGTYTLTGSIPNSKGPAISGLPSFGVPKSIKITGITQTETTGEGSVIICNEYTDEGNLGAAGVIVAREGGMYPVITNGELLFNLNKSDGGWDATHELWTGSGEYAICLQISGAEGWDDDHPPGGGYHRRYWWTRNGAVVKYNIKDALTTIPFSEFEMEW